jgi:GNAT superfamily N-acetyltransferase
MLKIRSIEPSDRRAWDPLWAGYLTFYGVPDLPQNVTEHTWRRFFDPAEPLKGLVADDAGDLIGFAHYLFHASTWALTDYCYLEDLFTAEQARGRGVGRALIEAVADRARGHGSDKLYWMTQETNLVGQRLYDKVGRRAGFIQYVKSL